MKLRIEEWLGSDNTLGIDIWERKYRADNESFDAWLHRVSAGNEDIQRLILAKKFLFAGRILASRGLNVADKKTTYSNCYVITPPEDNLESIFECASKLARTYSYGGGCGTDISKLSPRGSKVRNAAKESSGAVSFMDLYSLVTGLIAQNGRRGALMLSMDCRHPDIEEFIDVKKDLDKITKANISVRVSDDFMDAVVADSDWELSFTRDETGEVISKTVKARELLTKLAYNNWDTGEPGILYWDRIKSWNLLSDFDNFEYAGVNPCLTGDTLISTTDGEIQIKDLVGKTPYVYCMGSDNAVSIRQASKVWMTRKNAQLVEVVTARGSIRCTPDHLIHTGKRGWIEACNLIKGDKVTGLGRQNRDLEAKHTVKEVRWLDVREDVYDMTVPDVHNFVANRMVVHNCGEEPLPAGGSCLLGSINLSEYVTSECSFDFDSLSKDVVTIVTAMNDVLDEGLALHPLQEQRDSVRDWRQIGIGVMGIADMLIRMGIRYGNDDSCLLCEKIANTILNCALLGSANLAAKNGKTFPMYDYGKIQSSMFYQYNIWTDVNEAIARHGLYNSQLLTIAPTGTLSTMLGISGGIEPIFANYYIRKTESLHGSEKYYKVYTPIVQRYMEEHGITNDKDLPDYFVTATDLCYSDRISMQSVWQDNIDASISSTVNLPHDATPEDVFNIYVEAWKAGLKGITVFRDGCRRQGVLTTESNETESDSDASKNAAEEPKPISVQSAGDTIPRGFVIESGDQLVGKKRKLVTGCGSLHVVAFFDPITGDLMETYLSKGSTGGCQNYMIGLSRMISLSARAGCSIEHIIDQLDSCGVCPSYANRRAIKHDTSPGSCCPMAVGNALMEMWEEMQAEIVDLDAVSCEESESTEGLWVQAMGESEPLAARSVVKVASASSPDRCPLCHEPLVHSGGCCDCKSCGWSNCGG